MASAATMPPTPQQSFNHNHMMQQASPSGIMAHVPGQQTAIPPYNHNHGYSMSFDNSQSQPHSQPIQPYSQSFHNGPVTNHGYTRSFGGAGSFAPTGFEEDVQIYTAVYSGITVYEMEVHGIACMRRRADGWLNATQILKVAGVDKGKRTKVLEKEILTGEHEKVQGGYGKYQGTWISYKRGREFCRQYGVEEVLRPLLDYDVAADGSCGQGQETPTKEQAMAANRKRFYNTGLDSRAGNGSLTNGTFFHNISPSTSVALAAMNKAARINSPAPKPSMVRRQSQQQDAFVPGSQQSMVSDASFATEKYDSGYSTQPNGEPPRKRRRAESQEGMAPPALALDVSMQSMASTEMNESFMFDGMDSVTATGDPIALPPIAAPSSDEQQDKMNLILDLFAEPNRVDYTAHRALTQLSGEDLNMPLDVSANNALHWAATLAKVPLLKLLIQKGANIWRGNAAGQSPLISAVLVNNCWEHSCFPEVLELLGPLIEARDLQGRTILHHIAVSCGIKGRAPSSKYYLEALLEFLVRIGQSGSRDLATSTNAAISSSLHAAQQSKGEYVNSDAASRGTVTLGRFISHIVNARDKAGNTALNLVARIGNRSIIQQLLEIHADPNLANHKGVSAKDFGAGTEIVAQHSNGGIGSQQLLQSFNATQETVVMDADQPPSSGVSQVEDIGQDVISSMTTLLNQSLSSHKDILREKTEQIDLLNEQIREASTLQKAEEAQVQALRERIRLRSERQARIANLRRAASDRRSANARTTRPPQAKERLNPTWLDASSREILNFTSPDGSLNNIQRQFALNKLPSIQTLRAYRDAYAINNTNLQKEADELKSRSSELETMYRKVVSLCTGVAEDKVDESLSALVAAVESERGSLGEHEIGRVRDFLRRVDHAGGGVSDTTT